MKKKPNQPEAPRYKTDEMLHDEAIKRMEEHEKLKAAEKPAPAWKKKAENYWYHYKWHTLFGAVMTVILVFVLKDIFFTTRADVTVLMVSRKYYDADVIEALTESIEMHAGDFNGDGKVYIIIDYIYYPQKSGGEETDAPDSGQIISGGGQLDYTTDIKLSTVIAAGTDPLYIIDDGIYEHFLQMAAGYDSEGNPMPISEDTESMFVTLDEIAGAKGDRLQLSDTVIANSPVGSGLEDLSFCLRYETSMSGSQNGYYEYCMELLKAFTEATAA